jgi:hypothetical protein
MSRQRQAERFLELVDADNAALASRNVAPWANRVVVRHGPVWTHDGTVNYAGSFGNKYAFRVTASVDAELGGSAPAFSLTSLARELTAANGQVDYVKWTLKAPRSNSCVRTTGANASARSRSKYTSRIRWTTVGQICIDSGF